MRKTSDVNDTEFPFADDGVAFIFVYNGYYATAPSEGDSLRGFSHASTRDKKLALLQNAKECDEMGQYGEESSHCSLLAVWPGATRSDVFLVDDLDEALASF